jgi:hypothetical protein
LTTSLLQGVEVVAVLVAAAALADLEPERH